MVLDDIFERFVQQSPVTVMVRAALEHALSPQAIDALFEPTAERQYPRTLLFAAVVDLMGTVGAKIPPAVNAAYRAKAEALSVSLRAVSDKLDRTAPGLSAEWVRHTARSWGRWSPPGAAREPPGCPATGSRSSMATTWPGPSTGSRSCARANARSSHVLAGQPLAI